MQAYPFPSGNNQRSIVILPGPTSPGNSFAYGPGLDYGFTTRAGVHTFFWVDALDGYGNPRLVGGDQIVVVFIAESQNRVLLADVSNFGNGSYLVGYNITVSGRYSLNIVMKYGTDVTAGEVICSSPIALMLSDQSEFDGGSKWCHVGSERLAYFSETSGKLWCPSQNIGCTSYSLSTPYGLSPIRPASPYRFEIVGISCFKCT